MEAKAAPKKKAATKKKAAVKKKTAVKKKAAPKKKFKQAVEDSMPQVKIPNDVGKDNWSKMEEYTDGFILTAAITILGTSIIGLIWLLTK